MIGLLNCPSRSISSPARSSAEGHWGRHGRAAAWRRRCVGLRGRVELLEHVGGGNAPEGLRKLNHMD